ncbi:hypothetical protein QQS21_010419 [Conoideocrella luteorostrata]|uniref:Peptidase S8/S53 domain-containing protein n=1 Tax=Conoideocrella luteorostrata TaxID=1105319 RepID=A0AAJ0CFC8_9HYPO|nr:hypothetical protein QQS21_010419 [Conoideocrella luteorostrata]
MKSHSAVVGLLFSTCLAALLPSISSGDSTANLNFYKSDGQVSRRNPKASSSGNGLISQQNAALNLVRMSHNQIDGASTYDYDKSAGQGITVYVIDGGIRLTHEEFEGRATFGKGFSTQSPGEEDMDGHGTHVAAIIGGVKYGVAKNISIISVKIDVDETQMLNAADFVLEDVKRRKIQGKAVISMSMHVSASQKVDEKFQQLTKSDIVCVVSAGNSGKDAGGSSPGRDPSVITVAALDHRYDTPWDNSNYGPAVDLWAPGVEIESADHRSDSAAKFRDGTSQATPHVAGLAAYIMALEGITKPNEVAARLKALAKQSGAPVQWNMPNTTDLIASSGVDKSPRDPSRVKKLPWVDGRDTQFFWNCGSVYSDMFCGTQIYCDAFDSEPEARKGGFFKSAQECFRAHDDRILLPWVEEPPKKHRPSSCAHGTTGDDCPDVCGVTSYGEDVCGTRKYCDLFKTKNRPYGIRGFKDADACIKAHHSPTQKSPTKSSPRPATAKLSGKRPSASKLPAPSGNKPSKSQK